MRVRGDEGFTLMELLVAMAIGAVVMTLGILALHGYLLAQREAGTVSDVRSTLRLAQERSLSEGRTYCVSFTATTWTLYKSDCTIAANKAAGPYRVQDTSIKIQSVNFPAPSPAVPYQNTACPTAGRCAYFYPRGTALAGSVTVVRGSDSHLVQVEGLTGRVSST